MFLYVVCILALINAFGSDAATATIRATRVTRVTQMPCFDRIPQFACQQIKNDGSCDYPGFEMIAKYQCRKTCNKCFS